MSNQVDPLLIETVERLLGEVCTHSEIERAETDGWSEPAWSALAEAGFPWVGIGETGGGSGGSIFDAAAVLTSVGRHAAAVPMAETALLGGWLLEQAGLALPDGPVTVVEPESVSIADGVVLVNGVVAWARQADLIVVPVLVDEGLQVCAVEPAKFEITPGTNLAGEARDSVSLSAPLRDLNPELVPAAVAQELTNRGALSRVLLAAGALETVSDLTMEYTTGRYQFGKPVASFQAVQHHMVMVKQSAVRARMAADIALRALAGGTVGIEVSAAKVVIAGAIDVGTRSSHQAHGAMGVTREYELHQVTRRLWSWQHEWGTTKGSRRTLGSYVYSNGADDLFSLIAG